MISKNSHEYRLSMFLAVANRLLHQGRRAVDENNECVYLSEDGLKCAAGCLLPEEHYDEDIEGAYVTDEQVIEHFNMAGVNLREQANEIVTGKQ